MTAVLEPPVTSTAVGYRPTWAEVDLEALRWNLNRIRAVISPGTQVAAVVKANAYGHGAVEVSQVFSQEGVHGVGVSTVEEGLALRSAGFKARVFLLGTSYPFEGFEAVLQSDLTPTVSSLDGLQALEAIGSRLGKSGIRFHLKVETGMGRIGVSPAGAVRIFEWLGSRPTLCLEGIYTHFSSADSDSEMTRRQLDVLRQVVEQARRQGHSHFFVHAANSAAIFSLPESHMDWVRPGLSLYGISPFDKEEKMDLRPVLSWKTRIAFIKSVPEGTSLSYGATFRTSRPSRIATLPVGYADGYRRELSNAGQVLIHGVRCPAVGRVTMDHTLVDVTDLEPHADVGDEAVLLGNQEQETISAWEIARICRTIPYEILCGISPRVPRVFRGRA